MEIADETRAKFQSTRPVKDATPAQSSQKTARLFQSTRPVKDATFADRELAFSLIVSIHASREGRDPAADASMPLSPSFNPRVP